MEEQCFENVQCVSETGEEMDYSVFACECPCNEGFNCTYYNDTSYCEGIARSILLYKFIMFHEHFSNSQ